MSATPNLLNVAGLAVGVLGILLAIFFGLRSRRTKRILYVSRRFNLLGRPLAGLPRFQAQYDGKRLANLTAVKFLLWNRGSETLTPGDFAKADPLRIVLAVDPETPSWILEAGVVECTNPKCGAALSSLSACETGISFEFLAPGDAILLSVLHSGAGPDEIALRGTLKGGDGPRLPRLTLHSWPGDLLGTAMLGLVMSGVVWMGYTPPISKLPGYLWVPLVLGGASVIAMLLVWLLHTLRGGGSSSVRVSGSALDAAYLDEFKPDVFRSE